MRWTVAVAVLFTLTTAAYAADYNEGGYASRTSVIAGGTISFHIATAVSPFELQIVNLAQPNSVLTTIGGLTSAPHDCTGLWETGCAWPVTTQFTVPATWPSGYYAARFPTGSGRPGNAIFVVRSANPGVSANIVVISPTHTYAAYNNFGGKSLDDAQSTNNQRAHIVSFNRPYTDNNGLGRFPMWEQQFVDWMKTENRPFDVITDEDAEDATLVNKYRGIVLVGQSEYWTLPARQILEKFIREGAHPNFARGDIAIFGGSTMLWQARMNAATRQLTCYKDRTLDPENGVHNELVTVQWYDAPVFRPENMLIGGSFRNAGYSNRIAGTEDPLPDAERVPYTVRTANHWLLAGTGLSNGATFGKTAAGTRVGGVIFTPTGPSTYRVNSSDGTPPSNVNVLASVPSERGYGTISFYTTYTFGRVFNAGTRDWSHALGTDAVVQQISRNVIDMLIGTGDRGFGADPNLRTIVEDYFQLSSTTAGVVPGWEGTLSNGGIVAGCTQPGSTALRLAGPEPMKLTRNLAPTNQLLPHVMLKLMFSVGQPLPDEVPVQIATLSQSQSGTDIPRAVVEIEMQSSQLLVRAASLADDGTRIGTTEWLPNYGGLVLLRWKTGGALELTSASLMRPVTGNGDLTQRVNQVAIGFNAASGSICMKYLSVRNPATPVYLSSSQNPILTGDTFSLVARIDRWDTAGTPTGTMTLRDGATVVASRPYISEYDYITFDVAGLSPGLHSFTVTYDSTSPDFDGSTSEPLLEFVGRHVRSDLNRDGKSDIVLSNANPSRVAYWLMNDTTIMTGHVRDWSPWGPDLFEPITSGDFGGDGHCEVVHFVPRPGAVPALWGSSLLEAPWEPGINFFFWFVDSKPVWRPFAAPDFNGDGQADLLLRNTDTGAIALWLMHNFQITTGTVIGNPGLNLVPIDAGNFGGSAIIFQNQTTGAISRWLVNGTTVTSDQTIATPAAGWKVAAVGDFDGNGFDDLALQNSSTRSVAVWLMDSVGTTVTKGVVIATPVEGWKVVGAGDYDGNGRSDLLLHNVLTNSVAQWQMNGTDIVKGWTVTTAPGWKPLGR